MPAVVSSSTGDVASSAVISNAATAAVASGDAKISSTASSSESGQVTVMPLVMPMPTAQAKDHPAENQEAKRDMFAFDQDEEGGAEKEEARLARWKKEDPIALQDAFMTSNAFLKACKDDNLPEALEILQNSVKTDFLQYHVIQGYYACIQNLNFELFHQVFQAQGFPVGLFPEIPHAIAELCTKETFPVCRKFFQPLFRAHQIPVDHPRHRDGMTPLCIACLRGCLPLSIILLEDYHASCNVITKHNLVPYQLNLQPQPSDDALATEGRQLLKNRFECFRVGKDAQEVLRKLRQAPAPVIEHKVWAGSTDF